MPWNIRTEVCTACKALSYFIGLVVNLVRVIKKGTIKLKNSENKKEMITTKFISTN